MTDRHRNTPDTTQHPAIKLPAMYTLIRARILGSNRYNWTGHIYDVSLTGLRFELDMPIQPGTQLEIRAMLPGQAHTTFRALGTVTRIDNEQGDLGPTIMALDFQSFQSPMDRHRLAQYIDTRLQAQQTALRQAA